jgi:hypothetical protein
MNWLATIYSYNHTAAFPQPPDVDNIFALICSEIAFAGVENLSKNNPVEICRHRENQLDLIA